MTINRKDIKLHRILMYLGVILFAILCVSPFYIMIINATRSSVEINQGVSLLPGKFLAYNFANLERRIRFIDGFLNSSVIAVTATILSSYVTAIAAFGFSFYNIPFKKVLFGIVLAAMMVPAHLGMLGYFDFMQFLKLMDTRISLILPFVANSFAVFFLVQYIKGALSIELVEAARIDGANELAIFHRLGLPIMMPGIATMGIFTFVMNWNNYILPLILIYDESKYTVPLMIGKLNSTAYQTDFGMVYLGIAMSIVPIMIIFAFLSRYLIEGISAGGIKE